MKKALLFLMLGWAFTAYSQDYVYNMYDRGSYALFKNAQNTDSIAYPKNTLTVTYNAGARPTLTITTTASFQLVAYWDISNIYVLAPTVDSGYRKAVRIVYDSMSFGPTGATGPSGPTGATGPSGGPLGPTGPTGAGIPALPATASLLGADSTGSFWAAPSDVASLILGTPLSEGFYNITNSGTPNFRILFGALDFSSLRGAGTIVFDTTLYGANVPITFDSLNGNISLQFNHINWVGLNNVTTILHFNFKALGAFTVSEGSGAHFPQFTTVANKETELTLQWFKELGGNVFKETGFVQY